ncbi:372_t:CDS:2 [Funneliformis mosseae]|uniref:Lysophospholipase NTE1 n=1 Tax=Funneliformis mosseae TaxID=27381 RepID=A0A9N9AN01_FUNMO|nr:372_t:CDS:2 [Funneliformis mosseae]
MLEEVNNSEGNDFYSITVFTFSTILSWFFSLVSYITITLSSWILRILSWSFTLRLNFITLLIIFVIVITITYLIVRYRILTKYSRLPTETTATKQGSYDLHPALDGENVSNIKHYPDEFLSMFLEGIKIFGYLEKPVFHELARHLSTKKLLAGESLMLEKERSFYIVVDGFVQVFVKTANEEDIVLDPFESDDYNRGYQLLNEVTNGGTLSSLFTILSLFTDDIDIRYDDPEQRQNEEKKEANVKGENNIGEYCEEEKGNNEKVGEKTEQIRSLEDGGWSNARPSPVDTKSERSTNSRNSASYTRPSILRRLSKELANTSVNPNITARATVDTTLAVIPAEAFHRLTEKFPKSVANIVQVILTRFQRVTLWTGYKYLGLTKDLLRTEKLMNDIASYGLSKDFFKAGSMERLRMKFVGNNKKYHPREIRHHDMDMSDTKVQPSNGSPTSPTSKKDYDTEDDLYLRESVLEGISKGIGLLQSNNNSRNATTVTGCNNQQQNSRHNSLDSNTSQELGTSGSYSSLATLLNISDDDSVAETISSMTSELDNDVEILYYQKGSLLVEEGERNVGLFFVIDGLLDVFVTSNENNFLNKYSNLSASTKGHHKKKDSNNNNVSLNSTTTKDKSLFMIKPGGLAGYLAALTGFHSFVNIRASTDTYVGYLSKQSLNRLMEKNPNVLLTLAKRLITLLSPLLLHIDFALDWVQVNAGQVLHREGDSSDSIYIVLNGRVRTINEKANGIIEILGEYGQGQSVGELEVMTGAPRPYTLHAIRDTELARMPRTLFNALALRHPEITLHISRIIASRTRVQQETDYNNNEFGKNNTNLKTVCILPVNGNVPITEFAEKLKNALVRIGENTTLLNQESVINVLGKHAFNRMGRLKLISWLAEQEENVRIVLYLADGGSNSSWTQTCIRQADCILLVGTGDDDFSIGEYESFLIGTKTTARKELVLLYPERNCTPGSTRNWLKNRPWIHAHHHVSMRLKPPILDEKSRKNTLMNIKDQLQKYYPKRIPKRSPATYTGNRSDFSRLARRLVGKSIGLVLGGGGARGIAHIGVIKAFEEAGIPIDIVGGTSIGSFIGGLYARDSDNVAILGRAKAFSGRTSSKWRQIMDLTWPRTAWFTGHAFNRGIWKSFSDTLIEDFWLSYFCITTNITWSRMEVHKAGYAWRYIRASMSLAAYLPPLCENGNLLVDGGYMDNLPVGVMKSMGANTIFAVDVASHDDTSPVYYGDSLSGFWVLLSRFNPFSKQTNIPTMTDIQSRLAYVSSVKTLEEAKNTQGCFYMQLPVQQFGTLEFNKFDEILKVGYKSGKEMIKKWKDDGKLNHLLDQNKSDDKRNRIRRRNSV